MSSVKLEMQDFRRTKMYHFLEWILCLIHIIQYGKNKHADGNVETRFLEIIRLHFFRKIICAMIYLANYRVKC